jgi:hypothetical protein
MRRLAEVQAKVNTLRVRVNKPGAEVFVDGASVGMSPVEYDLFVDPGTHTVEARLEGYPPVSATVTLAKGKGQEVGITLVAKTANKTVIIAGAAVAGVGAVMGGVFAGLSAAKAGSATTILNNNPHLVCPSLDVTPAAGTPCGDLKSVVDAKSAFGSTAVWSFVGAGVVGIGTAIYALTAGGPRSSRSGLTVAPVASTDGGGLFVSGSF